MHAKSKSDSWPTTYGVSVKCKSQVFDATYLVYRYVGPVLAQLPIEVPHQLLVTLYALDTWTDSLDSLGYACSKLEILQPG